MYVQFISTVILWSVGRTAVLRIVARRGFRKNGAGESGLALWLANSMIISVGLLAEFYYAFVAKIVPA